MSQHQRRPIDGHRRAEGDERGCRAPSEQYPGSIGCELDDLAIAATVGKARSGRAYEHLDPG